MVVNLKFTGHLWIVIFLWLLLACSINTTDTPLDAILFDRDGVLIDTEYSKYEAWRESLKKQIYHEKKKTNNQPILSAVNFLKDLIIKLMQFI